MSLLRAPAGSVHAAVRQAMETAGWRQAISPGADIALKPNLGWDILLPGAVSAPWVVEGVIETIRDYVGRIYLVESSQVVVDADRALRRTGMDRVCKRYGVEWVNMSSGPFVRYADEARLVLREVDLPEILTRTQLITLPLMKTHNKTTVTGAIKNQWGCLRALRHKYHRVLAPALVDVNVLVRPHFAVMDATIGLEGNGPKSGKPKEMGLVLASADIVALDTVAAALMGFDPERIDHIQLCARMGLGVGTLSRIDVRGEQVSGASRPFEPARHNAVSGLELLLRGSVIDPLVFESFLFPLFCWGARRYYDLWDLGVGRRLRAEVFAHSAYAPQWTGDRGDGL